jgi:hypothetical protein
VPTTNFAERRDLHRHALERHLRALGPLHLLTNMYGNTSDALIWDGTRELLVGAHLEFDELEMWRVGDESVVSGTLVIPGSGAFHEYWHEWLPDLVKRSAAVFDTVVVLPSSYDTSVPEVADVLTLSNVQFFAREPVSYRAVAGLGPTGLSYDPALFSRRFPPPPRRGAEDVLVSLRTDQGSRLADLGWRIDETRNDDISVTATSLDEFIERISAVSVVVTDRLHVAVAAAVSGRELRFVDPYDRKVTVYFDYVFRGELGDRALRVEPEWLAHHGLVEAA